MAQINISINTDGQAWADNPRGELFRALDRVSEPISDALEHINQWPESSAAILDSNGNTRGGWVVRA